MYSFCLNVLYTSGQIPLRVLSDCNKHVMLIEQSEPSFGESVCFGRGEVGSAEAAWPSAGIGGSGRMRGGTDWFSYGSISPLARLKFWYVGSPELGRSFALSAAGRSARGAGSGGGGGSPAFVPTDCSSF